MQLRFERPSTFLPSFPSSPFLIIRGFRKLLPHSKLRLKFKKMFQILGANNPLGGELASQFTERGCRVAKVPSPVTGSWKKDQLKILADRVKQTFGDPDILVYVVEEVKSETNDPLDRLSTIVTNDLKEHFHVSHCKLNLSTHSK